MKLHECLQALPAEAVLGQEVRWVDLAVDLAKVYAPQPDGLLDPLGMRVEVPQFAEALTRADTDGRRAVGP